MKIKLFVEMGNGYGMAESGAELTLPDAERCPTCKHQIEVPFPSKEKLNAALQAAVDCLGGKKEAPLPGTSMSDKDLFNEFAKRGLFREEILRRMENWI